MLCKGIFFKQRDNYIKGNPPPAKLSDTFIIEMAVLRCQQINNIYTKGGSALIIINKSVIATSFEQRSNLSLIKKTKHKAKSGVCSQPVKTMVCKMVQKFVWKKSNLFYSNWQ